MLRVKLAIGLVIAAAISPPAAYAMPDPFAPVAEPGAQVSTRQDLRSPDARDAQPAANASPSRDLRSPDARDAAREPAVVPAESARVSPKRSARSLSDGFEWSDAAIGAAVMLALMGVAGGTFLLISRSRHRAPTT
jgi:hypothetical protein